MSERRSVRARCERDRGAGGPSGLAGRRAEALLEPHPSTPVTSPLRLRVRAQRCGAGELALHYVLEAPLSGLRISPPAQTPGRRDLLWQHTCFEAFVTASPGGPYHEINLSPSGDWAVYGFRAHREPGPLPAAEAEPALTTEHAGDRFELRARIALAALDPAHLCAPIFVGLSAVIESASGLLAYLSLRHPAGRPDFHHADGFCLRLDPPI